MSSSQLKRIKWRQAYRDSVTDEVTFSAKLTEIEESIALEVDSGREVSSTATGQRSVSFFKGVDPQDRASLILELQDLYTQARTNLVDAGDASPSDLEIHNEGDELLKPIDSFESDYSEMRVGRAAPAA